MNPEVQRIRELLIRTYEGDAWHGPSVQSVIADLSTSQALRRAGDRHNAAELVYHMSAWRNFVAQRLSGNDSYELSESENWSIVNYLSDEDWQLAQETLHRSQHRLLALLSEIDDELLKRP